MAFDVRSVLDFISISALLALLPAVVCLLVRRFGYAIVAAVLGGGGFLATHGYFLFFPGIAAIGIAWIVAAVAFSSARRSREIEAIRREVSALRK